MRIPTVQGNIERRVLVNYRVDPVVLKQLLPTPFRPQLVDGYGVAGICLIRLGQVRPRLVPACCGLSSENAAYRIAVQWETDDGRAQTGVYVPRRETSSKLNALAGGRVFPGRQHLAKFEVREASHKMSIEVQSRDQSAQLRIVGETTDDWPTDSIFASLEQASQFFQAGSVGFSPQCTPGRYDVLEFQTDSWHVEPLAITELASSFFDDERLFPAGSATLDNALLMRDIAHRWCSGRPLCCSTVTTPASPS